MTALLCLAAFAIGYCLGKGVANYRAHRALARLDLTAEDWRKMQRPPP
jgi:hypothetical protein